MRRFIAIGIAVLMCIGMTSCDGEKKEETLMTATKTEAPKEDFTPTAEDIDKYAELRIILDNNNMTPNEAYEALEVFQSKHNMTSLDVNDFIKKMGPYARKSSGVEDNSFPEIPTDEKVKAYTYAQIILKDYLSTPSTSKFALGSDEYKVVKTGTRYKVESWVEAENKLGGKVRSDFIVILEIGENEKGEYYQEQYVQIGSDVLHDK